MATYYVKWDAAGAGDGSSWANAYTTIQAAITAHHAAGDIIEVSGGPAGHTYAEKISIAGDGTYLQASIQAGHSGQVTIDATGKADHALDFETFGSTTINPAKPVNPLILLGPDAGAYNLKNRGGTGNIVNDVVLGPGLRGFDTGTVGLTLNRVIIKGNTDVNYGGGLCSSGDLVSNNCIWEGNLGPLAIEGGTTHTINNPLFIGNKGVAVFHSGAATTTNINNPIGVANMINNNTLNPFRRTGGTLNINTGNLLGHPIKPETYVASTGATETGVVNLAPRFLSPRRNGYITISIDDYGNYALWKSIADYANSKGVYTAFFCNQTDVVSAAEFATMATYITAGNEVGCHTRNHPTLTNLNAITITGRAGSVPTIDITINQADPSSINWTGTVVLKEGGADVKTINITAVTTLTTLAASITAQAGWTGAVHASATGTCKVICLADVVGQAVAVAYTALFEQDKFWYYEIAESKAELEAGIGGGYVVSCFAAPGNSVNADLVTWIGVDANFTDAGTTAFVIGRGNADTNGSYTLSDDFQDAYTGSIGYKIYKTLSVQMSIEYKTNAARDIAALMEGIQWLGGYMMTYSHAEGEYSLAQWQTFIDTVLTYPAITIITPSAMSTLVRATFTDADADGLRWTKTFTDAQDYHLTASSPYQLKTGGTNVGLTTDYDSNAVPFSGGYPMGPYRGPAVGGGLSPGLGLSGGHRPPWWHRRR